MWQDYRAKIDTVKCRLHTPILIAMNKGFAKLRGAKPADASPVSKQVEGAADLKQDDKPMHQTHMRY